MGTEFKLLVNIKSALLVSRCISLHYIYVFNSFTNLQRNKYIKKKKLLNEYLISFFVFVD